MKSIRIKFCILMVLLILIIAGSLTGCIDISDEISTMNDTSNNTVAPEPKNTAFEGNCGVAASAQMGTDIIGVSNTHHFRPEYFRQGYISHPVLRCSI